MAKTLLIIGAGVEQVPAYQRAKARGLKVIGTDMNPNAPALQYADEVLIASTRDAEETTQVAQPFHQKHPIDGVMTIANDVPYTVASVANALGLPGISLDAARCASDKLLMKQRFKMHGVACPQFQEIQTLAELKALVQANPETDYVLKPIDGRGARGVLKVSASSDLDWTFEEATRWGDSGRLMIEAFIPGLQLSTESFIQDGVCYTPAIAERNYDRLEQFAPYFIEDGGTIPPILTASQRQEIDTLILNGAKAMGIHHGIVKGDLVIGPQGQPMIIELAARLSGGWFATHQVPEASGVDLVEANIRFALGEPVPRESLIPTKNRAVAIRYWFPGEGLIESVSGEEALKKLPGLLAYGFFRQPGEHQPVIKSHPDRFGYVIVSAADRESVLALVQEALSSVRITIQSNEKPLLVH